MYRPASPSNSIYPPDVALTAAAAAAAVAAASPPPPPPPKMAQTQNPPSLPSSFLISPHRHRLPSLDLGTLGPTTNVRPPILRPPTLTNDFRHLPPLPKHLPPTGSASTSILPIAALSFNFQKLRRRDSALPIERLLSSEPRSQLRSHNPYPPRQVTEELSPAIDVASKWPFSTRSGPSQSPESSSTVRVGSVFRSTTEADWKAGISSLAQLADIKTPSHESTLSRSKSFRSHEAVTFPQYQDPDVPSNFHPADTGSDSKGTSLAKQ